VRAQQRALSPLQRQQRALCRVQPQRTAKKHSLRVLFFSTTLDTRWTPSPAEAAPCARLGWLANGACVSLSHHRCPTLHSGCNQTLSSSSARRMALNNTFNSHNRNHNNPPNHHHLCRLHPRCKPSGRHADWSNHRRRRRRRQRSDLHCPWVDKGIQQRSRAVYHGLFATPTRVPHRTSAYTSQQSHRKCQGTEHRRRWKGFAPCKNTVSQPCAGESRATRHLPRRFVATRQTSADRTVG
jgi:hypothetical protein